jgi:hypothetical protein
VKRGLALSGAVCAGLLSLGLLAWLGIGAVARTLPTGTRTTVRVDTSPDPDESTGGLLDDDVDFDVDADPLDPSGDPYGSYGSYGADRFGRYWFDPATAESLVAELAAAVEGSHWCVGWSIVQQTELGSTEADVGSDRGLDVTARDCTDYVELQVGYQFTSSSSSLEDNAEARVVSSNNLVTNRFLQHPAYDISAADLLHEDLGHNEDDLLANAVAGLPLVLAESGDLDPLTVAPVEGEASGASDASGPGAGSSTDAPADDGTVTFADAEGEGGNDLWRANRTPLALGLASILGGLAVVLWAWARLPLHRAGLAAIARPGGLAAQGRAVNPRRALKAAMARSQATPAPTAK